MSDQGHEHATALLMKRLPEGAAREAAILESISKMVIRDRLVPPKRMRFMHSASGVLLLGYEGEQNDYTIHRHALGQLASKVKIPMSYVNTLQEEDKSLLATNFNERYHNVKFPETKGESPRFLHRIVGSELRGFLSRRYNRNLASAPLLRAFSDACRLADAKPIDAILSDVRVSLKCLMPVVFEAYPREYVAFGVEWSNSDFGAGKLSVCQTIWRVMSNTSSVLDESVSKVHLGSVIEESDIEMSEDTARKEVEAQKGAIRDAVKQLLSEKTIDRMLLAVRTAHDLKIPWSRLRSQLSSVLSKADIDWMQNVLDGKAETIIDLPPVTFDGGERSPNAWWASSCLSAIAQKTDDVDKKLELQREAGKFLGSALKGATA